MNKEMMLSVLFHVVELAVILALIWSIDFLFPGLMPREAIKDALIVVLAGLVKFARVSPAIPVDDYVNP